MKRIKRYRSSVLVQYTGAVLLVAAATGARALLTPLLQDQLVYPTYFVGMVAAGRFFGIGPGLLTVILGGFAADFFFTPPLFSIELSRATATGWSLYLLTSMLVLWLIRAERDARSRADTSASVARERLELLEAETTQRRNAEASERRQRHWSEQTLASIGDAVIATGRDGRIEVLNAAAEKLTGWRRDQARGVRFEDVFRVTPPGDGFSVDSLLAGRDELRLPPGAQLVGVSGAAVPVEGIAAPIRDEAGEILGAVAVVRDIANRRKTEEERDASLARAVEAERQTKSILESIADGFAALDAGLRFVYLNSEAEKLLGRPRSELMGKALFEAFPHLGGSEIERQALRVLSDGIPVELEWRNWFARRWYSLRGFSANGGISVFFRDITDRKTAECRLWEASQRLKFHVENSPLGMIECDPEFRVTSWTGEAERIFGWKAEQVTGRKIIELGLIPPENAGRAEALMNDILRGRQPRSVTSCRNCRNDGSLVYCEWYNSSLTDSSGRLVSVLSLVLDVTDRKQMEEQLRQAQKVESLGVLAGGVAHDFNNLLAGIVGNAGMVLDMLPPSDPSRPQIEAILRSSESAAQLTGQLVAYAGKGQLVIEKLDISDVVRESIVSVQRSIPLTVRLELELADGLPAVSADRGQMSQLISNLVLNGAEAIEDQRIGTVSVLTALLHVPHARTWRSVDGRDAQPGDYVLIEVRDTGRGFDDQIKARMFDPFFSTKFMGRGLGLSAAYGIVRSQGGFINVDTERGKGSAFRVLLPPAPLPAHGPVPEGPAAGRNSGTVLVADDEETFRETVRRMLEEQGYEVLLAENGRQAIDLIGQAAASSIRFVLMDWTMPVMGGEEAVTALKRLHPDVPIVVCTGYSQSEAAKRFEGAGVTGFVQKPFTWEQLASELGHARR